MVDLTIFAAMRWGRVVFIVLVFIVLLWLTAVFIGTDNFANLLLLLLDRAHYHLVTL
jgi:hypothetical protein